jgi:hypothetical protein
MKQRRGIKNALFPEQEKESVTIKSRSQRPRFCHFPIPRGSKTCRIADRSPDLASSDHDTFPSLTENCFRTVAASFLECLSFRLLHGYWDSSGLTPDSHGASAPCVAAHQQGCSFVDVYYTVLAEACQCQGYRQSSKATYFIDAATAFQYSTGRCLHSVRPA